MINIYIIIIIVILLLTIYFWIDSYDKNIKKSDTMCNLENFDIDNMHVINRDPYYEKLINKMIDEKAFLFTDEELKILKNKFQIYNVKDNKIQNISKIMLLNCKDDFDYMEKPNNTVYSPEEIEDIKYQVYNDKMYTQILNRLDNDINSSPNPTCKNLEFLKDPFQKLNANYQNSLTNYYLDVWGNNIISSPKDYMANYYTTINNESLDYDQPDVCVPVKTIKGKSNFILPNAYTHKNPFSGTVQNGDYWYENHATNIWNVDNERIINPATAY